jgi:sulfotransferase family protein
MKDPRPKPNFFIVGAPRCGTTALYSYLRQHPDVFMPEHKEPHFFNADMMSGGAIRNEEQYLNLFAAAKGKKCIGEASVYYLSSKIAPHAIKEFSPAAKIIVMVREPVEVMYALHANQLSAWAEDVWDFETALSLEEDRRCGRCLPRGNNSDPHKLYYRETVSYARHLKSYLDVFGSENVLVIIYDDFKRDTANVFRRTCSFLGINPDIQIEFPVVWSNPAFRSPALARFVQRPPRLLRGLARMLLPSSVRCHLVGSVWVWNLTRTPRPPMPEELRKRLIAELAPQVRELSALIGRDLSCWSQCGSKRLESSTAA